VSRIGAYQAAAARYSTTIERADASLPPRVGGAITKHPLAPAIANALVRDLRQLGAEAKTYDPRSGAYAKEPGDDRLFVYLAGCSFQKTDRLDEGRVS